MSTRALEALDAILSGSEDADDALRSTVNVLVDEPEVAWVGIAFLEDGTLVLGPRAGHPDESRRTRTRVVFQGADVGELWVDGAIDPGFLEQVAALVAVHVLIGWDTRGEAWTP